MRVGWFAGLVGIVSVVAIAKPDAVGAIYEQLYPSDATQRRALNECFTQDPAFNRLDPAAREACYRHSQASVAGAAAAARTTNLAAGENFVDLWRAAGQGHLPQNDVRAAQRNLR
jgi:hypothetical protein